MALVRDSGHAENLKLVYVESPANPTNTIIDIEACRRVANAFSGNHEVVVAVDNTYMGPCGNTLFLWVLT